jgi:hypothetical protein
MNLTEQEGAMSIRVRLQVAAAAIGFVVPGSIGAQEAMPTSLARVLAEAARDFRTGAPVYLVARVRTPQYVIGAFPDSIEARRLAIRSGSGFRVYGPYTTPADSLVPAVGVIDSVTVFWRTGPVTYDLPCPKIGAGLGTDALFFTAAAWEKFLIPYYSNLYGPEVGELLRQQPPPVLCHCYGTLPCGEPPWGRR